MNYNCPVCNNVLVQSLGTLVHPGDGKFGVNLFCSARECPAQEVAGHGENLKQAWLVIQQKFVGREERENQ